MVIDLSPLPNGYEYSSKLLSLIRLVLKNNPHCKIVAVGDKKLPTLLKKELYFKSIFTEFGEKITFLQGTQEKVENLDIPNPPDLEQEVLVLKGAAYKTFESIVKAVVDANLARRVMKYTYEKYNTQPACDIFR